MVRRAAGGAARRRAPDPGRARGAPPAHAERGRPVRAPARPARQAEAGAPLHAIDLETVAPAISSPTLVVHDRDDALVEIADARVAAAALPAGTLVETHGLGHSRILRASEVVGRVVEFVAGEEVRLAEGPG